MSLKKHRVGVAAPSPILAKAGLGVHMKEAIKRKPKPIFSVGNDRNREEWAEKGKALIDEISRGYCTGCGMDEMKISMTMRIACRKCGKTRLIQKALKTEARK